MVTAVALFSSCGNEAGRYQIVVSDGYEAAYSDGTNYVHRIAYVCDTHTGKVYSHIEKGTVVFQRVWDPVGKTLGSVRLAEDSTIKK